MTDEPTPWIKASASGNGGECVQMRRNEDRVELRDSKLGDDSPLLAFTRAEFAAWLDGARKHEFDHFAD